MLSFRNVVGDGGEDKIAASGARTGSRTVRAMSPRRRRLDRRTLLPRDYLRDPYQFGVNLAADPVLPSRGDAVSQQVAMAQHHLAVLVRAAGTRATAADVTRRFGFSKQYWSRCLLGQAWMGETVQAAAVSVVFAAGDGRDAVQFQGRR